MKATRTASLGPQQRPLTGKRQKSNFLSGTVEVGYSPMDQLGQCMCFKVGHPREVAELIQLIVNPDAYIKPDEECSYGEQQIGDMAEIHLLVPDGKTWRVLDPSDLPAEVTHEFCNSVYLQLVADCGRGACEACMFAGVWPDLVKTLPAAAPYARAGYILEPHIRSMKSAVEYAVMPPVGIEIDYKILIIPRPNRVSSLYLREAFTGDAAMNTKFIASFLHTSDIDGWVAAIKAFSLRVPLDLRHQIRLGAEQNAMRQWMLFIADRVANQGGSFSKADRNWHLAHTLSQLLDADA